MLRERKGRNKYIRRERKQQQQKEIINGQNNRGGSNNNNNHAKQTFGKMFAIHKTVFFFL